MTPHQRVLFLCTGNACRSQMAEAWTRHLLGDQIEASSAGSAPKELDPLAVEVMLEAGVEMAGQHSKKFDPQQVAELDLLVTVCDSARDACPLPPTAVCHHHQPFPDPPARAAGLANDEERRQVYRDVRDQIRAWVYTLPRRLANRRMSSKIR